MVRIAPVRLSFNPKTLWFDALDFDLKSGDKVVVSTARGTEFGTVANPVFEKEYEEVKKLKSPLKPVKRLATDEDVVRADEMAALSQDALPVFRRLAAEMAPDMNPVAVEYLFDGDKAVFYFESEERIDFRDLVRKLAAEFHIRVDMKQIGVRDGARMVGGLGHCGQELCCRRLGGEFNPVSIRMAKEQDLSLNPQKISGTCGRLMCCLRYEYDAYKDFHSRAPKKNAKIETPDGEGKVVDLDVPREIVSIKVGDEKPVKVPLADMEPAEEGTRPKAVGQEAWDKANEPPLFTGTSALNLFSNQLSGEDKLAQPGSVRHVHGEPKDTPSKLRSRRRSGSKAAAAEPAATTSARKPRRRRSTTVASDGTTQVEKQDRSQKKDSSKQQTAGAHDQAQGAGQTRKPRRRRRGGGAAKQEQAAVPEKKNVQVGRNSSALRSGRHTSETTGEQPKADGQARSQRRRRRTHKPKSESGE